MELNGYHIVWAVSIFENGKAKFEHFASKEDLDKRFKPQKGAKVYIITDKQFGMIQNTWNGTTPEVKAPFTHSILIEDGKMKSLVSLSQSQFNNAKQY